MRLLCSWETSTCGTSPCHGFNLRSLQSCFAVNIADQMYPKSHVYNCGIIGAAGSAFHEFVDSVARMLDSALAPLCDMAAVNLAGLGALHGKTTLLQAVQGPTSKPIPPHHRTAMLKAIAAVHHTDIAHGLPFNCPFRMIELPQQQGNCSMAQ
jgi:hypothetical protein